MQALNAILAFAITMLIMSMIVSTIVECLQRLARLREKGLQRMMEHVFDRVIAPYIAAELQKPGAPTKEDCRKEFIDLMTVNRAPASPNAFKGQSDPGKDPATLNAISEDTSGLLNGRRMSALDIEDFMARLGGCDIGKMIAGTASGQALTTVLDDIQHRFAAFGTEVSEYFERRARLISVIVAIFAAWFFYVHPKELIDTYFHNPEVVEAVIKLGEERKEEFKAYQDKLDSKEKEATAAQTEADRAKAEADADAGNADKKAKADETQEHADDAAASRDEADAALQELKAAIEAGQTEVTRLQSLGVPIGWTAERLKSASFHSSQFVGLPVPNLKSAAEVQTILWLLLGGLLIGLGGPYWHDLVVSLTNIRDLVGAVRGGGKPVERRPMTESAAATGGGPSARFTIARQAKEIALAKPQDDPAKPAPRPRKQGGRGSKP